MKIVNTSVSFVTERETTSVEQNIWIDIFPLDGMPSQKSTRYIHLLKLKIWRMLQGMQNIEYVQIEENRSLIRKILVKFAKIVPIKKFISQATVKRGLDKELKKYKSDDTWLISNYMGTYHERETFPIEFFGKGKKIKFEDDYMCYKIDERNVQINEGTN